MCCVKIDQPPSEETEEKIAYSTQSAGPQMEKVKAAWTASSAGVRKHIQKDHNLSRGRTYSPWKTKISLKDVIKVGP